MKQFIVAAVLAIAVSAGSSACLYCRNQDLNSGFMVSYSYCKHQDVCLKDAWNYINRDCLSKWQSGDELKLSDCEPDEVSCPEFVSSPEKYQKYKNTTWSMAPASKCTVNIDATDGVARVIFSDTIYLGIEYKAKVDDVITIESGVTKLTIYNAAETGPITFGISFSGASALAATATALAAISLLSF